MQDPTIHITISDLKKILTRLAVMFPEQLAEEILVESQPYAIRDRFVAEVKGSGKAKKAKKAEKFSISEDLVEQFNGILTSYRKANSHRFIPIKREDVMWKLLSEVAHDAMQFCTTMEYKDINAGMLKYISKGIELMRGKYGLARFKSFRDRIVDEISLEKIYVEDEFPIETTQFTECYLQLLAKESGISKDGYTFTMSQRVDLLYARRDADLMKVDYFQYLKAQFAELNFLGGVPETVHLHGDNAKQRVRSYLAKQGADSKDMDSSDSMLLYYRNLKKGKNAKN